MIKRETNISIDIGGSKVQVIEYNHELKVVKKAKYVTSDYITPSMGLEKLFIKIKDEFSLSGVQLNSLGIAINCAIKNNKIILSSLLGEKARSLDLRAVAGDFFSFDKFYAENDVIAMANAELKYGIGKTTPSFTLINLGTGVRIVNIVNNQLMHGWTNQAGEISLISRRVHDSASNATMDSVVAGRAFTIMSQKLLQQELSAKQVFQDPLKYKKIISLYAKNLTEFLWEVSYFYNPEVIVFTGSLTKAADVWLQTVKHNYFSHKYPFFLSKDLKLSSLEYSANLGVLSI